MTLVPLTTSVHFQFLVGEKRCVRGCETKLPVTTWPWSRCLSLAVNKIVRHYCVNATPPTHNCMTSHRQPRLPSFVFLHDVIIVVDNAKINHPNDGDIRTPSTTSIQ